MMGSQSLRFDWERNLQTLDLAPTTKLVGLMLATYANGDDGDRAHPGEDRLATNCGLKPRAVREHLWLLLHLGLIVRTERHGGNASRRRADSYQLALPADVVEHIAAWRSAEDPRVLSTCPYRHHGAGSTVPLEDSRGLSEFQTGTGVQLNRHHGAVEPAPWCSQTGTGVPHTMQVTKQDHAGPNTSVTAAWPAAPGPRCERCGFGFAADGECLNPDCRHMNRHDRRDESRRNSA